MSNTPPLRQSASTRFIERFLRRSESRLTGLVLGQLDAFNRISTTFGFEESKRFCSKYVEGLRKALPLGTPVIRLTDRRFVILLPRDSVGAVMDVAARLTEDDRAHVEIGGDTFVVDLTVGVAMYPTHADDASSLFRRAELALKEAHESELAFAVYSPDATRRQAALWKLESDLERAVHQGELEVYYQPKIGLSDHRARGVEALARWRAPSGTYVPPQQFVPLAERTGTIAPLTWLVFERVAESVPVWAQHSERLSVAVNVSPQVLHHSEFFPRLDDLLSRVDAAGVELVVELTEESLVTGDAASMACLERVRKLGVGLSIDDFGKGFSSLSYLKEIPATEVKIDKRFVGSAALDDKDRQVVRVVVELARAFRMSVVAEGVDSDSALRTVASLGCDAAQGFFIARPMRAELVGEWLRGLHRESARFRAAAPRLRRKWAGLHV
jgi:EAL domain-containing protein (putative c-di-GMP-specific phosphodiesterase class I)/GGDEF domain-containing protein